MQPAGQRRELEGGAGDHAQGPLAADEELAQIQVPTLVIGAQHDTMDPAYMEMMAGRLPNGRYLHCPNGYGRSKLGNAFVEKQLGVGATTRNWRTTLKLLELAS